MVRASGALLLHRRLPAGVERRRGPSQPRQRPGLRVCGRARRKAGSVEAKKDGAVEEGTGQADVDVEPAVTEWTCTVCLTPHDYVARQCRVCKTKRVPATNVAAAQAASSAEDVAAKVAKLQEAINVMTAIEAEPVLSTA